MSRNRCANRFCREPKSAHSYHPSYGRDHIGMRARFEELGYNYGFARADPDKNSGYCFVYRTLKNKLENVGIACRIRADEYEIRLTELEGPLEEREKVTIFAHDVISYYKFNHRVKFIAICIDAYQRKKTGYWFLCFEREGQLTAFCDYLNWLFNLEVIESYEGGEEDRVRYVDRRSRSVRSFVLSQPSRYYDGDKYYPEGSRGYDQEADDSGYTETSSEVYSSKMPTPPPKKIPYPRYSPQKTRSKRYFRRW